MLVNFLVVTKEPQRLGYAQELTTCENGVGMLEAEGGESRR
jgi:hypothetical protein